MDALPEAPLRGTVRTVSGVASRGIFDAGTRQFDIAFDLGGHPSVRPGVSAAIAISGQAYDNVLYIPRTAVFDVSGKPTVYVRIGRRLRCARSPRARLDRQRRRRREHRPVR